MNALSAMLATVHQIPPSNSRHDGPDSVDDDARLGQAIQDHVTRSEAVHGVSGVDIIDLSVAPRPCSRARAVRVVLLRTARRHAPLIKARSSRRGPTT
jgi:hypothetical protein